MIFCSAPDSFPGGATHLIFVALPLRIELPMQATRLPVGVVVLAGAGLAQTNRGGISGTVTDQSGAVVPNAAVTITNSGTNQVCHTKTSDAGTYNQQSREPMMIRSSRTRFHRSLVELMP
jgi:hypothetical protein